jgi:hypothetical protein
MFAMVIVVLIIVSKPGTGKKKYKHNPSKDAVF